MYFIHFVFQQTPMILCVAAAIVCFGLCCILRKKEYFLPLTIALQAGVLEWLLLQAQETQSVTNQTFFLLFCVDCCLYACLLIGIDVFEKQRAKKLRQREEAQRLLFTLPDKENSFVQERLQTTLRVASESSRLPFSDDLQLEYMRKCISKLKSAKLSPADRLAVENYSKILTAYMSSEGLSASELQGLNDTFSALLKLCGKYAL